MDIEKLIEQLSARGLGNGTSLGYHSGLLDDAAAAISTLQAENEKLRETVDKYATAARVIALHLKPFCNESLPYDEMIADAARKASDELEQVKRDFGGICEYIDSEGFLRKQFCENGNPDLEPCICPSLQEHPGYIDSDDCEGCDHFCNSWCGQKED